MYEEEFNKAAEIRADFEAQGLSVGNNDADVLIAAHCIVNGYTLVTDNTKDFERIAELKNSELEVSRINKVMMHQQKCTGICARCIFIGSLLISSV